MRNGIAIGNPSCRCIDLLLNIHKLCYIDEDPCSIYTSYLTDVDCRVLAQVMFRRRFLAQYTSYVVGSSDETSSSSTGDWSSVEDQSIWRRR